MKPGVLLIRADANLAMGTGHVMRCVALAQAWEDAGGRTIFAMADSTPSIERKLKEQNFDVHGLKVDEGSSADAEETARLAHRYGAAWVVVDGYQFGSEYQSILQDRGIKVLFIDDNGHARHYSAALVLNQNAHADEALYRKRDASTRLLIGVRFVMLRREFTSWRGWTRTIAPVARRVLVTMGGSDPDNVTALVLEAILANSGFETTVIVGGSNPHLAMLRGLTSVAGSSVRIVENASDMPDLIAKADIAVAGAGTTSWELCFLGLPALLIVLADNQQAVADELDKKKIARNLGGSTHIMSRQLAAELRRLANDPVCRGHMSKGGRALVDGRGASRVVSAMQSDGMFLRHAEAGDCELFWKWANDPVVRASAFVGALIPWDDHVLWFNKKLGDKNCWLLVAVDSSGKPVGQIRFDKSNEDSAEIDLTVGFELRGLGHAARIIELGSDLVIADGSIHRLDAFVKPENVASAKAFERSGFTAVGSVTVRGQSAIHYVRMVM